MSPNDLEIPVISMDKGVYFVYGCAILVSIVLVFYIWQSSHYIYKSTEPNKTANWCKYSHELWPRTKKVFTLLMVFVLFITSSIYNQFIVLFNKLLFVSVHIGSAVRLSLSGLALRDHSCSCDVAMFTVGASMYEVLYFIHGLTRLDVNCSRPNQTLPGSFSEWQCG